MLKNLTRKIETCGLLVPTLVAALFCGTNWVAMLKMPPQVLYTERSRGLLGCGVAKLNAKFAQFLGGWGEVHVDEADGSGEGMGPHTKCGPAPRSVKMKVEPPNLTLSPDRLMKDQQVGGDLSINVLGFPLPPPRADGLTDSPVFNAGELGSFTFCFELLAFPTFDAGDAVSSICEYPRRRHLKTTPHMCSISLLTLRSRPTPILKHSILSPRDLVISGSVL
ncbi:hypothetical protein B0H14DRAFT_2617828 [Mycena olivaceomarginata]|nr:hypothetical protein B0H14DRAFT_2617828 [Mycena olivaceomarginata]